MQGETLKFEKPHTCLRTGFFSYNICIAGVVPQTVQLQAQAHVTLESLGWCHKPGERAKSCACRSVCFCTQIGTVASFRLLTQQLQSCSWWRRAV